MKLLVVSEVFYPEEFLINELVKNCIDQGIQVEVLTKTPSYPFGKTYNGFVNKIYQSNFENGIKLHRIKIVEGYENSVIRKVSNYILNAFLASVVALRIGNRFDAVFTYQTGPLTFALPGALIHKFYKKKTVIWSQDLWPDTVFSYGFKKSKLNKRVLNSFVRFIYKHMDVAMVTSLGFIESLTKTTRGEKVFEYIPQWPLVKFDQSEIKNIPDWNTNKLHFTFTGNVGKVQNLDNVIRGFAKISKKHPDSCQLNIIGDGSHLNHLKKLVNDKQIRDVVFHGRQSLDSMSSYYAVSDILLISLDSDPSFEKYIPAKFQSYLTCAKPVFAIMNGEVKNLVEENDLGWTAPPGEIIAIANKFEDIYLSPKEELNSKGKNAQQLLDKQFNREIIIEKITGYF